MAKFNIPKRRIITKKTHKKTPPKPKPAPLQLSSPLFQTSQSDRIALLIGCEYTKYASSRRLERLPGCHADVDSLYKLLIIKFGFKEENIRIQRDNGINTNPSLANIQAGLEWISSQATTNPDIKHVFVYYSGHGTQTPDKNGDESDHKDECIVPCDFLETRCLTDDNIASTLLKQLPAHVTLTLVSDSCNSGTLLDLPYRYKNGQVIFEKTIEENKAQPTIVTISGCRDDQTSASSYNLDRNGIWRGAMTCALEFVLKTHNYSVDTKQLLDEMTQYLVSRKFTQRPVLCFGNSCNPESILFLQAS
jgi:hypothetical protein